MTSSTVDTLQKGLGVGRILAGGVTWLAPELGWKQFGVSDSTAADPEGTVMAFLQSTYAAAADLAKWDRAALDRLPIAP